MLDLGTGDTIFEFQLDDQYSALRVLDFNNMLIFNESQVFQITRMAGLRDVQYLDQKQILLVTDTRVLRRDLFDGQSTVLCEDQDVLQVLVGKEDLFIRTSKEILVMQANSTSVR